MRLRIAPSPTGTLHIGTLRTTLFNWIFAKHHKGTLVLRIEDTDAERSKPEFEKNIIDGIDWMGLTPDEGPVQGGSYGPYRQSERMAEGLYLKYAQQLLDEKKAYYCFCSDADLDAERQEAELAKRPYIYSRKCIHLSLDEIQQKQAQGLKASIRFKMPDQQSITFADIIRGDITFDLTLISDFVIIKSDLSPSYNFAVVVDDWLMAISHVIRGEDHISNTPRQLAVFEAFGQKPPLYAHLPMILGPDKSKLSKRHGATSVTEYAAQGYLSTALFNYLVLLGWSSPDGQEILSKQAIIDVFSLERISKSGAVFDITKLKWMNGQYIRQLSPQDLTQTLLPFLNEELAAQVKHIDSETVAKMMASVQDNLDLLPDVNIYLPVYFMAEDRFKEAVKAFVFSEPDRQVIGLFCEALKGLTTPLTPQDIESFFNAILTQTGLGKGKVFKPIRIACTGMGSGPHLPHMLSLLGKELLIHRCQHILSL
jgi:nondiscriminating glutamyl-tRNA synthetase